MYVLQCILNTSYNAMMYTIYDNRDDDDDNVHDNDDDYCKRDGDDVEDIEIRLQLDNWTTLGSYNDEYNIYIMIVITIMIIFMLRMMMI